MTIRKKVGDTGYQKRTLRTTYKDAYMREFIKFYNYVIGKKTPKTSIKDARKNLDILRIIMQAGEW